MTTSGGPADETRRALLSDLFTAHADQVLRYALRHLDRAGAHDVVSDTFLVAWQRVDDIPDPALPWLLVVARNSIHNRVRSRTRRERATMQLAAVERAAATAAAADELVVERATLVRALGRLGTDQREALLLVSWDGLTGAQAAAVVGCSRAAFDVRLHRARKRLREALADDEEPQTLSIFDLKETHS